MNKQLFPLMLTLFMSMFGEKAYAAIEVKNAYGISIYYEWTNNKTELAVTKYRTAYYTHYYSGNVHIPESVEYEGKTYSVTSIGAEAFSDCTSLTSVTIPNTVTSIGYNAFAGCTKLTSITIPASVTTIACSFSDTGIDRVNISDMSKWCNINNGSCLQGYRLYLNGGEITDLIIPDGVTSIGKGAFSNCISLKSVTIPNSVTSIGQSAFSGCTSLTSVTIPNSVTSIGEGAFSNSGLTSVTIPNSVTSIGKNAFQGCTSLTQVCSLIQNPFSIDMSVFNYSSIALTVPIGTKTAYEEIAWWKYIKNIREAEQCAKPTITYNNGKVSFSCETEGVEFHYIISNTFARGEGSQVPFLPRVSVYATKSGYANSDVSTVEIEIPSGLKGDLNNDNKVNVADHVELSNIIMNQDNTVGE